MGLSDPPLTFDLLDGFSWFLSLGRGSRGQEIDWWYCHVPYTCPHVSDTCFLHVKWFRENIDGFLWFLLVHNTICKKTCRTRVGHVAPSYINFLTSRTPIKSPRSSKLDNKYQRYDYWKLIFNLWAQCLQIWLHQQNSMLCYERYI